MPHTSTPTTNQANALDLTGGLFNIFSSLGLGLESKRVAESNAQQLIAAGESRLLDAKQQAFGILRQGRRLKGTQRATSAARGVVVETGSSLDIITESIINTNLRAADRVRIGNAEKIRLRRQASAQLRRGKAQARATGLNVVQNLLEL